MKPEKTYYKRYPAHVGIETFHGCNARCTFCHVNLWARPKGLMPETLFDTILDQLSGWGPKFLKQTALTMNGEPLLDPNIENRLAKCKEYQLPNVGFTTNGSLMTSDRSEKIIAASPDYIVFSFDTFDKEAYEANRIRLKHEAVLNNVLAFIEHRNAVKSNTRIVIRHIDFDGDGSLFEDYRRNFQGLLIEDLDEIGYTKVHSASFLASIIPGLKDGNFGSTPCGAVFNRLTIQHDGHVALCPHDYNTEYDFGCVTESHLLDIFNSDAFNKVRKIHEDGQRNTISKCSGCDEPELNTSGDMYAKYTPSGKLFFANVYVGFDHNEERKKVSTD